MADRATGVHERESKRLVIGILSTYPPTQCGLATFSAALEDGLVAHGAEVRIVRVCDRVPSASAPASASVVGELVAGSPASLAAAAELFNECDAVIVQHEYGVYGGEDGDDVVELLAALNVPAIVIAHTVLRQPTVHQRSVLEDVARLADAVVVMSEAARLRLCSRFDVDPRRVSMIPHGAATPPIATAESRRGRPMLLTWGLVGPGKGIERVIDAMPSLAGLASRPRYLVAGQTHPKVLAAAGESYRNARIEQAWRNGVAGSVAFDATYRDVPSLTALVQSATAVVLPYDSREQATSGVLVDAIAAGVPVVATAFPHAVEMLESGAGVIVDHDDPGALVHALQRVVGDTRLTAKMAAEAARIAPSLGWPVVSGSYLHLARSVLESRPAFA